LFGRSQIVVRGSRIQQTCPATQSQAVSSQLSQTYTTSYRQIWFTFDARRSPEEAPRDSCKIVDVWEGECGFHGGHTEPSEHHLGQMASQEGYPSSRGVPSGQQHQPNSQTFNINEF